MNFLANQVFLRKDVMHYVLCEHCIILDVCKEYFLTAVSVGLLPPIKVNSTPCNSTSVPSRGLQWATSWALFLPLEAQLLTSCPLKGQRRALHYLGRRHLILIPQQF